MASEKTQLLTDEKNGKKSFYESVMIEESSKFITSYAHGNDAKYCCGAPKGDIESGRSLSYSHCHSSDKDFGVDKSARKKLIIASVLCLCFMLVEAVGGILANSLAIATDAAHLLADFASFMISLFSLFVATRPATVRMSFGYYRAEVIGALTSVLMIWVVTGILVYLAIMRIVAGEYNIDARIMVLTSSIGVIFNIIMGCSLQAGTTLSGNDGASDLSLTNEGKRGTNINVRAAFIHVIGDLLQSIGVLTASIVLLFKPEWKIMDPICTFLFSILVLATTSTIVKDVLNVLMQGTPKGIDFLDVQRTLFNIQGVIRVHNLRIWSLSMDKIALSTHLAIGKNEDPELILKEASNLMRKKFDIFDLTIQVEEYRDEMKDCDQCKLLE